MSEPRCWLLHKWGRWQAVQAYSVDAIFGKGQVGVALLQQRVCERCGKIQQNLKKQFG